MSRPERGWAYAAISVLFVSVMMATTEPTPLYAFWERSYGFGPIVTTLVFAAYAVGVIAALLFAGRDSDVDGRRPVLIACAGRRPCHRSCSCSPTGSPCCSRRG
ncbi:MAG: hypothetical protein M3Z75_26240 [Actinomycetota bacterium]|nr:hypothetical protein [Actinomycetota bacterium]